MLRKKLFRELRLNAGQFITIYLMVMIAALAGMAALILRRIFREETAL